MDMDNGLRETVSALAAGRRLVAILNSRQSKRPCGRDAWVAATVRAVDAFADTRSVIISSVGLNTYELTLTLAAAANLPVVVVAADPDREETIRAGFKLSRESSLIVTPPSTKTSSTASDPEHERDRAIVELADTLIPVSIRAGGFFARAIDDAVASGKLVDTRFQTPYASAVDHPQYDFSTANLNPRLTGLSWPFLTHWTRSHHGPLPWERAIEYYREIPSSASYPRSAFANLKRILAEQRIRASERFIREQLRVVAFTAAVPAEAIKLMRWRRRYVYYNFEPYGIAVQLDAAKKFGARPVIYGTDADFAAMDTNDRPFFQSRGGKVADWTPEFEWRLIGDCDLSRLNHDEALVIVYRPEEIAETQALTRFPVESLTV